MPRTSHCSAQFPRSGRTRARFISPTVRPKFGAALGATGLTLVCAGSVIAGGSPWAVEPISYTPGLGATMGYTNPDAALGEPSRFTGQGIYPGVVSPFNPPFLSSELVSIGLGGHLTLRLGAPAVDRPTNPFGVDLIIFSNAFFVDAAFPRGIVAGLFGSGEGIVEVSSDGRTWHVVETVAARGAWPTMGYQDSGPYDTSPGGSPTDFLHPVDPTIDPEDLVGLDYTAIRAIYGGSGGGVGIDLATVGLRSAEYVRISVAADAPGSVPIDAVTVVPGQSAADLNGDGVVDGADLGLLLQGWSDAGIGDLNADGIVDGADLGLLLQEWTRGDGKP